MAMNRRWFVGSGLAPWLAPTTASASALTAPVCPARLSQAHSLPREPRFRLGLVTYNAAADWNLATLLAVCRAVGLAAVELRTTHAHQVEPSLSPQRRREVKAQIADAGIILWGLGTVCEFHHPDPAVVTAQIETCKRFLQLAHDLGAVGVKVRPNGLPKEVPVEKTLDQIGQALRRCGQAAGDWGQEVWLEVHGPGTSQPAHIATILRTCDHPRVGVNWNSNREDITDGTIRPAFQLLQPWLKAVHINELYSRYPYRELFALLRGIDYDRFTMIEIPQKLEPRSGELLLRYYKALWTELVQSGPEPTGTGKPA